MSASITVSPVWSGKLTGARSMMGGAGRSTELLGEAFGGAPDQVLARIAAEIAGESAARSEAQPIGLRNRDAVADIGEGDQAVDQVIAIGAPADDVQIEIELGGGEQGAAMAAQPPLTLSGRPRSSLASIFFTSSASGLNCSARRH